jgi:hypothetical protein
LFPEKIPEYIIEMPASSFYAHLARVAFNTNNSRSELAGDTGHKKIVEKSSHKSIHKACKL